VKTRRETLEGAMIDIYTDRERTVRVYDKPCTITITRTSKTVWIATGEYMGRRIEVKGRSESSAANGWVQAARDRGNP
jgi:hypothetical protein